MSTESKKLFKTITIEIRIVSSNKIDVYREYGVFRHTDTIVREGIGLMVRIPSSCEASPSPSYLSFDELKAMGDGRHVLTYKEKLPSCVFKPDKNRLAD